MDNDPVLVCRDGQALLLLALRVGPHHLINLLPVVRLPVNPKVNAAATNVDAPGTAWGRR